MIMTLNVTDITEAVCLALARAEFAGGFVSVVNEADGKTFATKCKSAGDKLQDVMDDLEWEMERYDNYGQFASEDMDVDSVGDVEDDESWYVPEDRYEGHLSCGFGDRCGDCIWNGRFQGDDRLELFGESPYDGDGLKDDLMRFYNSVDPFPRGWCYFTLFDVDEWDKMYRDGCPRELELCDVARLSRKYKLGEQRVVGKISGGGLGHVCYGEGVYPMEFLRKAFDYNLSTGDLCRLGSMVIRNGAGVPVYRAVPQVQRLPGTGLSRSARRRRARGEPVIVRSVGTSRRRRNNNNAQARNVSGGNYEFPVQIPRRFPGVTVNGAKIWKISHSELIGSVPGANTLFINDYQIATPTLPWLNTIAAGFGRYRFTSVKFVYTGQCSTQFSGTIAMGIIYGIGGGKYTTLADVMNAGNSVTGAPWVQEISVAYDVNKRPFKWFYTGETAGDLSGDGVALLAVQTSVNGQPVGLLRVDYTVELADPQTFLPPGAAAVDITRMSEEELALLQDRVKKALNVKGVSDFEVVSE